ncbi:DUF421 domain-containing protein [Ectobacillus ponti]|uniref:DUF421 domain-containing protein n=1 Tax=Ectobacillus ponti TaxID=2961894 RepID=A0AA41X4X5_9BACI|nr:DUF421 domain-containing protein [Ectobacillus ponti]MCP8968991.1 DUF421 domain-containing protein [Ectobacillus ponti]
MPEHYEVALRTVASVIILLMSARILGKHTISQMTMFDFIGSISLGAIVANLAFNMSVKVHHAILAYGILVTVIFLIAVISLNSRRGRKFFAGDPTIVIQNGKVLEGNMRKMRYTIDYLNQQLREKDVFNIEEVLYAIIETSGQLTVLKKPQYRQPTMQDLLMLTMPEHRLPIELIMDGEVIEQNLRQNNLSHGWLQSELEKRKLQKRDVMYAVLAANGSIYIDTYKDHILAPVDKE